MIDLPGREEPRFPASLEDAARREIGAVDFYGEAYKAQKPIWHGINVATLLRRA
jgi:hypothetical protein